MPDSRRFFRSALLTTGTLLAGTALALPAVAGAAPVTGTAPTPATAPGLRVAAAPTGFTPALTPYGQDGQYGTTEQTLTWTPPDDRTYLCTLDGAPDPSPCLDPDAEPEPGRPAGYEMQGLEVGPHTLRVEVLDADDEPQPYETLDFVVQVEAPTVYPADPDEPMFGPTDGPETSRIIYFGAYVDQPDFVVECNIDDAGFEPCPDDGRLELEHLEQGAHTVEIRQAYTDRAIAGHMSETTTATFNVTPPHAPRIVEGPSGTVDTTYASFRLDQENPDWYAGSLECALDGADFAPCYDSMYYRELAQGEHVFRARQNVDGINPGVVTERRWIVDGYVSDEPTGPQFGDAPAETPAPAPAPAPVPAPKPELQAPAAPLKSGGTAVVGRTLTVGCTVPGATSYRCEVTVSKGGKQLGRAVRTGNGSVQIKLTRAGARQVQRSGRGLTVRVQVKATVDGKSTVTTKTVRLLPTKDIALSTDEFFGAKGAKPTAAAKRIAKDIAAQLSGARRITITGHTDDAGSTAANERLGLERAKAVATLLRKAGLGGADVVVRSAGETDPKASNGTAKGREQNRRVEVAVRY